MSNIESQDDDHITVSKIYETLKSGPYLKSLYWDVLSDLKEKDAFKKMRNTTEKLLNKKSEDIANLSDSESGNLQRKTIVTEICSMSYAIDTVYSKILFIKLQKEFKKHIIDAIRDLRQEEKIPDSVWAKLQISDDPEMKSPNPSENSAPKNNLPEPKPEASCRPRRRKRQKITPVELATKNREIRSEIHEDLKAINSDESKMSISRKNTNTENQVKKKATSSSVKNKPKKKQAEENQISSKLKTVTKTVEDIPKEDTQFDNPGSDAESEVSVGNVSLASVSSVHTSDLSSFDDEISLSSEDGENGEKRKFSLKELKEMSNNGIFSSKFNGLLLKNLAEKESLKKMSSGQKDKQNEASLDKADTTADSTDSSAEAKSPSQKTLPKRIRKPNSKYTSDNILCTIKKAKERRKPPIEVRNNVKTSSNETNSKDIKTSCDLKKSVDSKRLSRKRAKSDASDSEAETPSKSLNVVEVKKENDSESELCDYRSPPPQCASELYKPHFTVHSLTSRKTEPVTLYST